MEEVTRFMLLRPASLVDVERTTIPVRPRESLTSAFRDAHHKRESGQRLATVSTAQRASLGFSSWESLPLAKQLAEWGRSILDAAADSDNGAAAAASAEALFGQTPAALHATPAFSQTRDGLADWIACDKYRGFADEHSEPAQRAFRAAYLVEQLARNAGAVTSPRALMKRTLVLGEARRPAPAPRPPRKPRENVAAAMAATAKAIAEHRATLEELDSLPTQLVVPATGGGRDEGPAPLRRPRISQSLVDSLTPASRTVLQARGVRVGSDDTNAAHARLISGLRGLYRQQRDLERAHTESAYAVRMGNAMFEIASSPAAALDLADLLDDKVPTTHATMKTVGMADLLVVRQQLVRYEATDISYIENVLIGENRSREHKQSLVTEETNLIETETTKEETRDLQTTDRSELSREATSALKDQLSMQFGTKVSGSYGPTVQFAVNADLGFQHSKEEAQKFASTVAKENTQRTSTKLTERFKRSTTIKTTSSTEETNIHALDNRGRDQHVVGIYQWLDKVFEAQVFNYGLRMMFDIVVPEPAALMLHLSAKPGPGKLIKKPPAFDVSADEINEANYAELANKFGAAGLEAPPEPIQTVSKVLEGMDENADRGVTHQTADLPIPEGYAAISADVATDFWWNNVSADTGPAKVVLLVSGRRIGLDQNTRTGSADLDHEQGSIAVAMHSFRTPSVVATVSITCARTPRSVEDWRLKIYSALKQASDMQQQSYEEKLARAKAEAADASANPLRHS